MILGYQHIDGRDDKEGKHRADCHASDQNQTYRVTGSRPGTGYQGQGKVAGDRGPGGHHDGTQAGNGRFVHSLSFAVPL